jgi:hypothetical protein
MWNQDNPVLKEILKFPDVLFTCSADSIGSKFDYIRRGAQWNKFIENLQFLSLHKNIRIRINSVFFVLSAVNLIDTIDYFKNNFNINDFTINQCGLGQTHLRSRNLSLQQKEQCRININLALDQYKNNLNLVGQLKNCLYELDYEQDESYVNYLTHIDQLAGTNWRTTFKDLL